MPEYTYNNVIVHRVIDGDTAYLTLKKEFKYEINFGFKIKDEISLTKETTMSFRLIGIDTPEIRGEERPHGLKAKLELERLLSLGTITAVTYKPDKYGRWLVRLFVTPEGQEKIDVNEELVKTGFANPYMR